MSDRRTLDWRDVAVVSGAVMLAFGLALYDWRLSLVAIGLLLVGLGIAGAMRGG